MAEALRHQLLRTFLDTQSAEKKKINSLPCLKVYIILFPKYDSNIFAHQVILKSLKANCHYSFSRDAVNFHLLFAQSAGAVEYTDCTSAEG